MSSAAPWMAQQFLQELATASGWCGMLIVSVGLVEISSELGILCWGES
jgi:hypothetical protein